jgi:hypothetical protein
VRDVLLREGAPCAAAGEHPMSDTPKIADTSALSPIELERRVSVTEAARIKGISEDSYRRHYSHTIEQVSPRRQAVKLKHAIA